jgi:hypothetical protein
MCIDRNIRVLQQTNGEQMGAAAIAHIALGPVRATSRDVH